MIAVDQDRKIHFLGKRSSNLEREYLRSKGFVHVTGLPVNVQGFLCRIGDKLRPEDCGRWNTHTDLTAVTTTGGEIWLRAGTHPFSLNEERFLLLKGRGGPVPLSGHNETTFAYRELLARMVDPDAGLIFDE